MKEVGTVEVLNPSEEDVFKLLWKIDYFPDVPTKKRNESYRRLSCLQSPFFKPKTNEDINTYLPKICPNSDSLACRMKVTVARKKPTTTTNDGIHYKFSIGKVHTVNNVDVTTVCQPVTFVVRMLSGDTLEIGRVDELKGSKVNMQHLLKTLIVLPNEIGRNIGAESLPTNVTVEVTLKKNEMSKINRHEQLLFKMLGLESDDEVNSN